MKQPDYPTRLAIARGNYLWQLSQIKVTADILMEEYAKRDPLQDDEDDALNAAAEEANSALNCMVKARLILEQGV